MHGKRAPHRDAAPPHTDSTPPPRPDTTRHDLPPRAAEPASELDGQELRFLSDFVQVRGLWVWVCMGGGMGGGAGAAARSWPLRHPALPRLSGVLSPPPIAA